MMKITHPVTFLSLSPCVRVEPIPFYSDLQSNFGTIRRYMKSRSCDVSKYVGLLVHIEKYLQVVHADESHQRTIDSYFTCDL